jgi:UDP-N-acetylglucosamine--N-acetylmuramyl-(pentapeptide) pyrophosphoryl-undecaprenol N-acetylglucosamine transferase
MKKIILTGGGSAGHVTPNLALIEALGEFEIKYIGSKEGIEKELVQKKGIPYISISSGKLRRYVSKKNISDAFRVLKGVQESIKIIKEEKPNIIFSKGGFVTVPVAIAGKMCGVPVIIHESDMTLGLANKIAMPYAKVVCTSFGETVKYVPKNKGIATGTPMRKEMFLGNYNKGLEICGFNKDKPIILVIGGSLGSVYINDVIFNNIEDITNKYQVIHICGKNNKRETQVKGYKQLEYVSDGLEHIFKIADIVVSRAGSNSINEILALKKLNILIPLPKKASRGDQILNAQSFEKQGFSYVIQEESFNNISLKEGLEYLTKNKQVYINKMNESKAKNAVEEIVKIIKDTALN